VSEGVVSAKRGWGKFGAKPAQSEAPARAAPHRCGVHSEEDAVERRRVATSVS